MDPVRGETAGSTAAAARRQVDTMMPPDVGDGGDLWGAIPQGFRRRFVRGRSRPTSANPVSRSESAISGPYNHRQRHLGSSSSTTTCSPETLLTRPKPSSGGWGVLLFGVPGAGSVVEDAVSQVAGRMPTSRFATAAKRWLRGRRTCSVSVPASTSAPGLRIRLRGGRPGGVGVGTPATGGHKSGSAADRGGQSTATTLAVPPGRHRIG